MDNIELQYMNRNGNNGAAHGDLEGVAAGNGEGQAYPTEIHGLLATQTNTGNGETMPPAHDIEAQRRTNPQKFSVRRNKDQLNKQVCGCSLWKIIAFIFLLIIAVIVIVAVLCTVLGKDGDEKVNSTLGPVDEKLNSTLGPVDEKLNSTLGPVDGKLNSTLGPVHKDVDEKFNVSCYFYFNSISQLPNQKSTEELEVAAAELQEKVANLCRASPALGPYFSTVKIYNFRKGSGVAEYILTFVMPADEQGQLSKEIVHNVLKPLWTNQTAEETDLRINPDSLSMVFKHCSQTAWKH